MHARAEHHMHHIERLNRWWGPSGHWAGSQRAYNLIVDGHVQPNSIILILDYNLLGAADKITHILRIIQLERLQK